jgi:hypothetical protein
MDKINLNQHSGDLERNTPNKSLDISNRSPQRSPPPERRLSDPGSPLKGSPIKEYDAGPSEIPKEGLDLSKSFIKNHIDKYVDNYWTKNIENKELSTGEIDE